MLKEDKSIKEVVLTIKKWVTLLLSKWRMIFLLGLVGGVLGFWYGYNQKPLYTATLRFALEDDKPSGSGLSGALGIASSLGFDLGGGGSGVFNGANLIELLKSRSMIEKTLLTRTNFNGKRVTMIDYYLEVSEANKNWTSVQRRELSFDDTSRSAFTRKKDSLMGLIYSSITKKPLVIGQKDKKTSIIDISFESKNELFAKCFVESLVEEVTKFYVTTRTKKSLSNVEILQKQADSVRQELNNAIVGVASSFDNTFNLNASLNIKRTPGQKRQVDVQANTAILTELVKNLELAKVTYRKETPFIHIIDRPILPLKKEKVSKILCAILVGSLFAFIYIVILVGRLFWAKIVNESDNS
jgi:uncharacterized protein involved in exopolysaccharide biosynthesis